MNHRHTFLAMMVFIATVVTMTDAAFGETLYVSGQERAIAFREDLPGPRRGRPQARREPGSGEAGRALAAGTNRQGCPRVDLCHHVSESKPAGGTTSWRPWGRSFRRTEASAVTASAGARGLDKASESYANRAGITQQHRDAVDRMTANKIPDEDIQAVPQSREARRIC